jgi:hypothetical protein
MGKEPSQESSAATSDVEATLLKLLSPLVQFCLDRGIKYQALTDLAKVAYVQHSAKQTPSNKPNVSQISVATGVHRKDVTRLLDQAATEQSPAYARSIESEVLLRWMTHTDFLNQDGKPKALPRQAKDGSASIEALCWAITRDVHPRSIVQSMIRLGMVEELASGDYSLTKTSAVPSREETQMLALLANNLSDHFQAAVSNVGAAKSGFLEQAVYGRKITKTSAAQLHQVSREQWALFLPVLMQAINQLPESQEGAEPTPEQVERFRVGMYFYSETDPTLLPNKGQS